MWTKEAGDPWWICLHTEKRKEHVKLEYDQGKLSHGKNEYPAQHV